MARIFSLRNEVFEVPVAMGLHFGWAGIDHEVGSQIAFQEQFLSFYRFLYENIQSVPQENPHFAPRPISLSLRAGALKAYVLTATSIIEGALAELLANRGVQNREALHRRTFGQLLGIIERNEQLLESFNEIWEQLVLIKRYRNFVHLGNAAHDQNAYWQDLLEQEGNLLAACDATIEWLSQECDGNP